MLDKRCLALLKIINEQCVNSGYKVFSTEELLKLMPSQLNVDETDLFQCVKTLLEREYINVKYQDEKEICLIPLVKGRLVFENAIDDEIEKSRAEKKYFIFSFVGALLGAGISVAVSLLIYTALGV